MKWGAEKETELWSDKGQPDEQSSCRSRLSIWSVWVLRWRKKKWRDRALSKFITEILPLADNESIPGTKKTAVEAEIISFCCIQLSEAAINLPTCSPELSTRRGGWEKMLFCFLRRVQRNVSIQKTFPLWVWGERRMRGGKKEGYYHIVETELAEEVGGKSGWGLGCAKRKM